MGGGGLGWVAGWSIRQQPSPRPLVWSASRGRLLHAEWCRAGTQAPQCRWLATRTTPGDCWGMHLHVWAPRLQQRAAMLSHAGPIAALQPSQKLLPLQLLHAMQAGVPGQRHPCAHPWSCRSPRSFRVPFPPKQPVLLAGQGVLLPSRQRLTIMFFTQAVGLRYQGSGSKKQQGGPSLGGPSGPGSTSPTDFCACTSRPALPTGRPALNQLLRNHTGGHNLFRMLGWGCAVGLPEFEMVWALEG